MAIAKTETAAALIVRMNAATGLLIQGKSVTMVIVRQGMDAMPIVAQNKYNIITNEN